MCAAVLRGYHGHVGAELERFGGTVEKFIGDAVMALFGAPVAHEDDPERAVRAALAIRDWADGGRRARGADRDHDRRGARLARRASRVGAGDGLRRRREHRRAAPGRGARQRHPRRRDDVPRDRARDRLRGSGARRGQGEARAGPGLPGRRDPRAVRRRHHGRCRDAAGRPGTRARPPARCARARAQRARAAAGHPGRRPRNRQVAPRLRAFARRRRGRRADRLAAGSLACRTARASRSGRSARWPRRRRAFSRATRQRSPRRSSSTQCASFLPDAAEADWVVRQLRPLVGLAAGDELVGDRRSEAFAAWRRFFEAIAEESPLVLVFEDLQWADDGVLDFIDHLMEWSSSLPLLIVATARPELIERRPGWGGGKLNAATAQVGALSENDTARLLAALLEQAVLPAETQSTLLARAGGNPLYAQEFVRMLVRPRPAPARRWRARARGERRPAAARVDPGHHRGAARRALARREGAHPGCLRPRQGRVDRRARNDLAAASRLGRGVPPRAPAQGLPPARAPFGRRRRDAVHLPPSR